MHTHVLHNERFNVVEEYLSAVACTGGGSPIAFRNKVASKPTRALRFVVYCRVWDWPRFIVSALKKSTVQSASQVVAPSSTLGGAAVLL